MGPWEDWGSGGVTVGGQGKRWVDRGRIGEAAATRDQWMACNELVTCDDWMAGNGSVACDMKRRHVMTGWQVMNR